MARIIMVNEETKNVFTGSSCAFGVFDGVHRGHRFLIDKARESAMQCGGPSIVLTFSIDPDELFAAERLIKLMANEDRISSLASSGVDVVAVLPFDRDFAALMPDEFLESTFGSCVPSCMHVGEGFRFGSHGSGDVAAMEKWGEARGMRVYCHDLLQVDGVAISSTRIRNLLAEGRVSEAKALAGHNRIAQSAANAHDPAQRTVPPCENPPRGGLAKHAQKRLHAQQ